MRRLYLLLGSFRPRVEGVSFIGLTVRNQSSKPHGMGSSWSIRDLTCASASHLMKALHVESGLINCS